MNEKHRLESAVVGWCIGFGIGLAVASGMFWFHTKPTMQADMQRTMHLRIYEAEQAILEQGREEGRNEARDKLEMARALSSQAIQLVNETKRALENALWAAQCDAAMEETLKREGGD